MCSTAKDIATNVRLVDRLALRSIQSPIIGVNLSYDTSYSLEEWRILVVYLLKFFEQRARFVSFICIVPRFVATHLDISNMIAQLISVLDE